MTTVWKTNKRIGQAWRQPVCHLFLLCGSKTYVSIVWNICWAVCFRRYLLWVIPSVAQNHLLVGASLSTVCLYCVGQNICYEPYHLSLQKQLFSLTMEPSAGHVIKYYKDVLDTMYVAVGIKKLLKTNKYEILVRRCGSLVGSVPLWANST